MAERPQWVVDEMDEIDRLVFQKTPLEKRSIMVFPCESNDIDQVHRIIVKGPKCEEHARLIVRSVNAWDDPAALSARIKELGQSR